MFFFYLSSNIRSIIIIILISSCLFLFNSNLISLFSYSSIIIINNHKNLSNENPFPLNNRTINIHRNSTIRLAIVSSIYNENYIKGVEVLGYSLRRLNIQADLILLYISNRLNQSTLNRCRKIGWHLWPVERIHPPRFAIIYPRFYDQYTKLRLWSMIGYDRILYLDADTLVIRNINELFTESIFDNNQDGLLAAVEDVWQGQIGPNFNAGVLLIQPNKTIFNDMLIKMHNMQAYGSYWAEQNFLNWYFKGSTGRLPLIYNFNNVLSLYHHDIYLQLKNRMKIIHYTSDKPFLVTRPSPVFYELWKIWHEIHNEMLNQSWI